jgi:alkyl hydroperoxide reductase subunit AhpC
MDFTFVCPTKTAEFEERRADSAHRGCQILGSSTDTHVVHLVWHEQHPDPEKKVPLASDAGGHAARALACTRCPA